MRYTEPGGGFDEFQMNDVLYIYTTNYSIEWSDENFLEELLDAAYADLKMHERYEEYEECHKLKHFMVWAADRF